MFNRLSRFLDLTLNPATRDFIAMGYGIEARSRRCRAYWHKHLEYSKSFQRKALADIDGLDRVAVLGAGRLYDLEPTFLLQKFRRLYLLDADRGALKVWEKLRQKDNNKSRIETQIVDLTGSLAAWTAKLRKFITSRRNLSPEQVGEFLSGLVLEAAPELAGNDCIISLNLLSEIPVYWRNRVQDCLLEELALDTNPDGQYEPLLQAGLEKCMYALESQHLATLARSKARILILLRDLKYFYYQRHLAEWREESASLLSPQIQIENYRLVDEDSWLWHIAPQGIEQAEYGIINSVVALKFERMG